jgi:hypothetical protein
MELSNETLTILVFASLGVSALLLFLLAATSGSRRSARPGAPPRGQDALASAVESQGRSLARLESAVKQLAGETRNLSSLLRGAVQHVAVVRFDAFEDMGGRLSFSAALLDGEGDGVVITSINGRQDTRVYAKPVRGGTSPHNLSDEEEIAIRDAMAGARQTVEAR